MSKTDFNLPTRRIPELDGIRGIAILLVLVWHYGAGRVNLAWSGVDLFFVLSGFLIGGILLDNKHETNYFKVFYIRRVCRIFPLYFLWLTLFMIIVYGGSSFYITDRLSHVSLLFQGSIPIWSYATFTQNILMAQNGTFGPSWLGVTWSLAVEEQFYFVLPVIVYFVSLRKLPFILLFFIFAAPILRIVLFYNYINGGFSAYLLMPCRADALLLGVLCAYLVRQEFYVRYITEHWKLMYGLLMVSLLGISIMFYEGWSIGTLAMSSFGYSLLAIMYSCFLLIAVTEKHGLITNITRNKLLGKLGIVAYGVYIFHQSVNALIHAALSNQISQISQGANFAVTCVSLVVTLTISYLSWTFFEKPLVAIGHSFRYKNQLTRPNKSTSIAKDKTIVPDPGAGES